jgi:hypothetical protein
MRTELAQYEFQINNKIKLFCKNYVPRITWEGVTLKKKSPHCLSEIQV